MKKAFKIGSCLLAAVLLAGCSGSGTGSSQNQGKELVVGVRKNLSRFSYYYEDSDRYLGFEDDFAEILAEKLGYDGVKYVGLDAGQREDALSSGEVDCLIATFSRTESREETFDLSDSYYKDYGRVVIERSTLFDDWSDLAGKKVGYLNGSNAKEALLNELISDGYVTDTEKANYYCNMVAMNSYEDIISYLELGYLDAACMDGCIAIGFMDEEKEYLSEKYYSEEEYCVATQKGSDLSSQINDAIDEMISDGTISELEEKWDLVYVYDTEEDENESK